MHRLSLLPAAAAASSFIDATAPFLLPSSSMPSLRLGSPALLAARRAPRPLPWLRCVGGARRGMCCSLEASRRGGDGDSEEEEKRRGDGARAAAERRLRGGGSAVAGSGELLTIPGVGPRNLRKLVDNGFEGVAHLKQLYRDKDDYLSHRLCYAQDNKVGLMLCM
ncbi:hypothetical protein ACQ4PT_043903 [Festuca glaucescens]